jgi:hypothetical protein
LIEYFAELRLKNKKKKKEDKEPMLFDEDGIPSMDTST